MTVESHILNGCIAHQLMSNAGACLNQLSAGGKRGETMLKIGDWYFKVILDYDGFLGWCAKTPNLGNSPLEVDFNETVHFDYGETAEDVIKKLSREVFN
jgi:hypothetical protein